MRIPTYQVKLSEAEREYLTSLSSKGKSSARKQTRARILLKLDEGNPAGDVEKMLSVSAEMVFRARKCLVEEGLEAALADKPRPGQPFKLDDKQSAHVIALACSDAPAGHDHWTLRLLADKVVELNFAESISHETIRKMLKKTISSHGKASNFA